MGNDNDASWDNRGHFFAAAAEAMRRIVIEIARQKNGPKRGGHLQRVSLTAIEPAIKGLNTDMLGLDEALRELEKQYECKALLVKLRFFAGLSLAEAAKSMGLSLRSADRNWAFARAWLFRELAA